MKNILYKCLILKKKRFWGQIWRNWNNYNFKTNKDRDFSFVAFWSSGHIHSEYIIKCNMWDFVNKI